MRETALLPVDSVASHFDLNPHSIDAQSRPSGLFASPCRRPLISVASLFLLGLSTSLFAQVIVTPATPQVGSSNPVSAEPFVARPHTRPCVVTLLNEQEFADFSPKPISYAPPSSCPGPWAKVVFTADFTVTAGRQFDRTASFYLDHANIFYGTTAEPRSTLSPSWHVERDVTDLSAIFKAAQSGQADLGNFVGVSGGVTYNGIIYANASLEFYPAEGEDAAPRVPDVVVPIEGSGGDAGTLNTTSDRISASVTLPTNVERVALDVIAQSQSNDEFWYFCVPNDQTGNLESCGNTAFRETEIYIDGQAAGVAPVYPWIFTGGIDPYLWEPIPGVQTLNFKPYRVDLTPFAGLLADGNAHTVSIGVFNANSYFLATANLLAYLDPHQKSVSGGLISNSLAAAPTPVVTENISSATGDHIGTVAVASNRSFAIRGYVNTSHGRVETTVEQTVAFLSSQTFNVGPTTDIQNSVQTSTVDSKTTTRDGFFANTDEQHFTYPLTLNYSYVVAADGTSSQVVTVDQKDQYAETRRVNGLKLFHTSVEEEVNSADTLAFDASGNFTGPSGSTATASYRATDPRGRCYSRTLTAQAQKLTSVVQSDDCGGGGEDEGHRPNFSW